MEARRPPLPMGRSDQGYQTPTEESQPDLVVPVMNSPTPVAVRPPLVTLPSFIRNRHATEREAHMRRIAHSSLDDMLHKSSRLPRAVGVTLWDRIACYQWTFFTMTMATGGMANVLFSIPYRSRWLEGVGVAFTLLNILLFVMNCVFITIRFRLRPGSFVESFNDQVESLFIPAFFVSIAVICINICQYGVPKTGVWLLRVMECLFWIYLAVSVAASASMYLVLWSTLTFPIHMMTPTWVFPAYPMLLTGSFASNLIGAADTKGRGLLSDILSVALGAITTQGTGCLIALMVSAAFLYRLMTQKLPRDFQRPGVFISIGPFGFTVTGIVQLASQAELILPPNFLGTEHAAPILKLLALTSGLWLWGLSLWFFLVSVGSLWKYARPGTTSSMPFRMTWWSFVFPNTALVTATHSLGRMLDSTGLKVVGCVMAGVLVVVWAGVFVVMVRCLKRRELLWPKEDVVS